VPTLILALLIGPGFGCSGAVVGERRAIDPPRLLVLTDIGGDPDDQQSLIRLMLPATRKLRVGSVGGIDRMD
jgi:hypothetical protein